MALDPSWDEFYHLCDQFLRSFVLCSHVRFSDRNDCLQSAWKAAVVALPKYDYDGQSGRFFAWLYGIVYTKAIDIFRYKGRHPSCQLENVLESRWDTDASDSAPDSDQEQARVRRVFRRMSREESTLNYRVFDLRWIEGHTIKQIVADTGLTSTAVRCRLCRLRRRFKLLYEWDFTGTGAHKIGDAERTARARVAL
jgi:RNA polymerase sigma factor (sigma-70 family)